MRKASYSNFDRYPQKPTWNLWYHTSPCWERPEHHRLEIHQILKACKCLQCLSPLDDLSPLPVAVTGPVTINFVMPHPHDVGDEKASRPCVNHPRNGLDVSSICHQSHYWPYESCCVPESLLVASGESKAMLEIFFPRSL